MNLGGGGLGVDFLEPINEPHLLNPEPSLGSGCPYSNRDRSQGGQAGVRGGGGTTRGGGTKRVSLNWKRSSEEVAAPLTSLGRVIVINTRA